MLKIYQHKLSKELPEKYEIKLKYKIRLKLLRPQFLMFGKAEYHCLDQPSIELYWEPEIRL